MPMPKKKRKAMTAEAIETLKKLRHDGDIEDVERKPSTSERKLQSAETIFHSQESNRM